MATQPRSAKAGVQRHTYSRLERRADYRAEKAAPVNCTPETARCAVATSYAYDLPACCRAHIAKIAFGVVDAAREVGAPIFADYGTILGAVRNPLLNQPGGIVKHDKDADLGFLGEDWDKLLGIVPEWRSPKPEDHVGGQRQVNVGYALGFQWLHKLARQNPMRPGRYLFAAGDSLKVRLSATNHSNVDLFPWYDRPYQMTPDGKRHRYHFVSVDRYKGREFPENKLLPLREIEWEGRMLPCPNDPTWFCEHRYGRNWRTPLKRNNDGHQR